MSKNPKSIVKNSLKMIFLHLFLLYMLTTSFISSSSSSDLKEPTNNQKYVPFPVESRPWTNPFGAQILLETRVPPHFMSLTTHDFQKSCDGQCFFHPGFTDPPQTAPCAPKDLDCHLMASIAWHGPPINHCKYLGLATGQLTETICDSKSKEFYTISLLRHIQEASCVNNFIYEFNMVCLPREFVAISFYPEGHPPQIDDADKWYVCAAGERTVTFWEKVKTNPTQILDTEPHRLSAPGVIDARIVYDEKNLVLACEFILSTKYMDVKFVKFPDDGTYSGPPIKVKMFQGRVTRNTLNVPHFILKKEDRDNPKTELELKEQRKYYETQQQLLQPDFSSADPIKDQVIFANDFVGPSPTTIDFAGLEVELKQLHPIMTEDETKVVSDFITKLSRRCGKEPGKLRCYYPNDQKSCIFRERCKILFIAEEVVYEGKKVLQFSIVVFKVKESSKQVVRPTGWAAIGFSKDNRMGDDLVVACVLRGGADMGIYVSWNGKHANEFHPTLNQDLIFDKQPVKYVLTRDADKFVCQWKMNWKNVVSLKEYKMRGRKTEIENHPVIFDFEKSKKGLYMLFAWGSHVYDSGRISYHSFSQTITRTFKAKDVRGKKKSDGVTRISSKLNIICVLFLIWGSNNLY